MSTTTPAKPAFTARINRIEISATLAVVNEADKLRMEGYDLVDFGAGEPHFQVPQHIKDAAIAAINGNFSKYTAVGGTADLRDAIAARHATDFGTDYKREEVIASTGGKNALFNAFQVLVDHGDEVIVPAPYWVSFKDIVNYGGGKCVFVETDEHNGFALTPEMVERAITSRTKVILLNSPNNPTGAVLTPEQITSIVRMAAERGIYILSDECYVYLNYTGRLFSAASVKDARDYIVILGSLSKTYAMTGWRLGYALGPTTIIKQMQKLQSQSTSNPTSIIQKAAVAALRESQACVSEMREDYIRLRERIVNGLRSIPGIECQHPDGAFYAFPNVSKFFGRGGMNSAADVAGKLLREAHVVTVPGEAFGSPNNIRLSYATSDKEIDRGLERMRTFFAKL
ncbi:MAG TPA: pyridoxal phosphate-dependent aminotransferase [Terriglobales bacterium]|nr:pyridoxal phosphate-dependent aminotransferase [Terriglobales bacterium]